MEHGKFTFKMLLQIIVGCIERLASGQEHHCNRHSMRAWYIWAVSCTILLPYIKQQELKVIKRTDGGPVQRINLDISKIKRIGPVGRAQGILRQASKQAKCWK